MSRSEKGESLDRDRPGNAGTVLAGFFHLSAKNDTKVGYAIENSKTRTRGKLFIHLKDGVSSFMFHFSHYSLKLD